MSVPVGEIHDTDAKDVYDAVPEGAFIVAVLYIDPGEGRALQLAGRLGGVEGNLEVAGLLERAAAVIRKATRTS